MKAIEDRTGTPRSCLDSASHVLRISRRDFILALGSIGVAPYAGIGSEPPEASPSLAGQARSQKHVRSATAFGAQAKLIVLHPDDAIADRAMDAALAELNRVESVLSLYRPDSELCRLNREGTLTPPHPYLVEVVTKARQLSELSGGAFDVTVQPLWDLYATAKRAGRTPGPSELEMARRKVNWRKLTVTPDLIKLEERGMAVTLNALAQGFAADRALAALRCHSIQHALVNTGEIGAIGRKETGEPWTVGIQHPRKPDAYVALASLVDCCMATSGDYATRFSDDYVRHHIFDPANGESPQELASATVTAPAGLDADGLATAILVLGREKGLKLLQAFPKAEAFLVLKDGQTVSTPGFPAA
ncbi:MAG TPA: FAD:protein FMN transferase [Verrucomicrobiae bacterium]